jgi:hypothetical protein
MNPARELDICLTLHRGKGANRKIAAGANTAFRRPRGTIQAACRRHDSL